MQQRAHRGPGRPPAAKSADTRERIIKVAREVFSELGYDAATFQAIAVRADLTRPAINHYFSGKDVLYQEVLEQTSQLVVRPAIRRAQREVGLLARLSCFLAATVQADAEDRSAGAFLVASVIESTRHPELRALVGEALVNSREFLDWAVTDAVAAGELSSDADVASLVEMLAALLWGIGFYAGFVGTHEQLEMVTTNIRLLLANRLWRLNA